MHKPREKKDEIVTLFLLRALQREKIDHVFFVPGYLVDYFLPYFKQTGIRPIVAAHEGGAAYMADGYARASNKFGVCMGIGGPGVTNMVTALASAYGDRSPVLVIAGKISREDEAKGTFQDSSSSSGIDDVSVMRTVTEFAATVPSVKSAGVILRKAIRVIKDVESLPVFLSIPMDIQTAVYDGKPYAEVYDRQHRVLDEDMAEDVARRLASATRIAIFAGNGTIRSEAGSMLQKFAETFGIPVVTTLRAKGAIGENTAMSFGIFGFGGSLQANAVLAGSSQLGIERPEIILVLGATLNENNTFGGNMPLPTRGNIILVDINPNSNRDIEAYTPDFVMGDVKTFIEWIFAHKRCRDKLHDSRKERKKWAEKIKEMIPEPREVIQNEKETEIHPGRAILELRKVADEKRETLNSVIVPDSGAHTFFTGHYWQTYAPNEFLVMTTMGPMGYSIAAGIGAKAAQRKLKQDKPVVCVIGDGGMLMHGIELQSAKRNEIPLLVVVINNGALGNVYLRFKNDYKDEDGIKLTSIMPRHRWDKFAESLDVRATRVMHKEELVSKYRMGFKHILDNKEPFLIDVVCDRDCHTPNMSLPAQDRKRTLASQTVKPHVPWFG